MVIAGDFNNQVAFQSFMFRGLTLNGFADALPSGGDRQTSTNHRRQIDWIFVKGASTTGGRVARVDDTSDHYPVTATVSLR
jgi:endonuclease/exonuclease/phosphatase family metal-dependent hydrolase